MPCNHIAVALSRSWLEWSITWKWGLENWAADVMMTEIHLRVKSIESVQNLHITSNFITALYK